MRYREFALLAIFLGMAMSSCSQKTANADQDLRAAMEQRRAAFQRGDADGYAKLTADDLVLVDDDGLYRTKSSVLEQIRKQGPESSPGRISDLHLQINGDIGIVAYHVEVEDKIGNQSIKSETIDLETYKRQSGKWILISRAIVPMRFPNRMPADIDTAVYSHYVGVYDFGDSFLVTVKTDGAKLVVSTPNRLLKKSGIL
jgi:ketosteroid isomerase-like protein